MTQVSNSCPSWPTCIKICTVFSGEGNLSLLDMPDEILTKILLDNVNQYELFNSSRFVCTRFAAVIASGLNSVTLAESQLCLEQLSFLFLCSNLIHLTVVYQTGNVCRSAIIENLEHFKALKKLKLVGPYL